MRRGPLAGALTAIVTGGVISLLVTITGGEFSSFSAAILALTIPLLGAGMLFGRLDEAGRIPSFGRAMLYWAAAFPACRLAQQLLIAGPNVKDGLIGFVIYQAIVGVLFGLGFLMLYQKVLAGFRRVLGEPDATEPAATEPDGEEEPG